MTEIFERANTALITGGASGIGLALARKCVGYGMRVLVADWDSGNLDAARESLGQGASTIQVDVGKLEDWERVKARVGEEFGGQLNLLALNAGIGRKTSFNDPSSSTAFIETINTNLLGVIHGITTLLPVVRNPEKNTHAAIVITGSKQGITNPPGNPGYNASKAGVRAIAEHLSYDLRHERERLTVHLLVPGWTWTPLAGGAGGGTKPAAAWEPAQVVDFLEGKMREGQFWVLCPDNDVSEDMDRRRMLWTADDAVKGRPPLSRWREEFKGEFAAWMAK
ncbi:NAD(P)-binding protein [Xylariaceae sp. FL0662B]|nr:NAD(P)-binding protein [Xylariaceae sp. FL0662B]